MIEHKQKKIFKNIHFSLFVQLFSLSDQILNFKQLQRGFSSFLLSVLIFYSIPTVIQQFLNSRLRKNLQ